MARITLSLLSVPVAIGLSACSVPSRDPLLGYEFVGQIAGDTPIEQGDTVCRVARSRSMMHWLPHDTNATCQPGQYDGSLGAMHAFMAGGALPQRNIIEERDNFRGLIDRIEAWDRYLVGLHPEGALIALETDGDKTILGRQELFWVREGPFTDLELDRQGWAWTAAGGTLYGVDLQDVAGGPHAAVPLDGRIDHLAVDGDLLVAVQTGRPGVPGNALVVFDLADREAPRELAFAVLGDLYFESVGLKQDTAWVKEGRDLYAVDLREPTRPEFVDEDGVDVGDGDITLVSGDYLFVAPGFDAPLAVINVSRPRRPDERGIGFIGGNGVFDVAVAGSTLYLAVGSGGVHVWGPKRDYEAALEDLAAEGEP